MGKSSEILRKAREVGGAGGGQERAKNIKPLMDDIVGRPYEWTSEQCARFFEVLLRKYVEQGYLEQLLADSGIGAEFENIRSISKRHDHLIEKYPQKYHFDKTTLRKRGTGQIDRVAEILEQDRDCNDFQQSKQLLASILSSEELEKLGLAGIIPTKAVSSETGVSLRRDERISNIGKTDEEFVGMGEMQNALEDGFKEGYHIQLIGGAQGRGKSYVALEYARRHSGRYQIICWINASDENLLISSIVDFFNLAKVVIDDFSPNSLQHLFRRFFEVNENWLVVFDNAKLSLAHQQEVLKKYIPLGKGHVIITGTSGETVGLEKSKFHLMDSFIGLNGEELDDGLIIRKALKPGTAEANVRQLRQMCNGNPVLLTLVASYLRESSWMTVEIYLHMLKDRGVSAEKYALPRMAEAAFEIKMNAIKTQQRFSAKPICTAVEQLLILTAICGQVDLNLIFLSTTFPIFPDPLGAVCVDKGTRTQLIEMLRGFGVFVLRENVIHSNSLLSELSQNYFSVADKNKMCLSILERAENIIAALRENQNAYDTAAITALTKPYIERALRYIHWRGNLSNDELAQRYPNTLKN